MGQYENLVKSLRDCASGDGERCLKCTYHKASNMPCDNALMTDAAAAIEDLKARLGEAENSVERWKDMYLTKHEPKRGEWVEENRRPRSSQFICSECHRTAYDPQPTRDKAWRKRCRYAYCPNCGAKMEVQE